MRRLRLGFPLNLTVQPFAEFNFRRHLIGGAAAEVIGGNETRPEMGVAFLILELPNGLAELVDGQARTGRNGRIPNRAVPRRALPRLDDVVGPLEIAARVEPDVFLFALELGLIGLTRGFPARNGLRRNLFLALFGEWAVLFGVVSHSRGSVARLHGLDMNA